MIRNKKGLTKMRKPIIAGNWKMNKTVPEAMAFVSEVKGDIPSTDKVDAVIGAPTLLLNGVVFESGGTNLKVAAQNCYFEDSGAFTGETSPAALSDMGVNFVIIGHSERRELFGETDEEVNKKAKAIFKHNMVPIVCVGETLEEKEANETDKIVSSQVKAALKGLNAEQVAQVVLAYEPIWAIGSGKTATAADANATIKVIRDTVADQFDQDTANKVRIQYGGSVKPDNIAEFLAESDIDGALVGGASLEPKSFLSLLEAVK